MGNFPELQNYVKLPEVISMNFEGPIMSTIQGVWKPIMRRHVDRGKAQVQADSPKHRWTHHQSTSRLASAAEKQTWREETLMKLASQPGFWANIQDFLQLPNYY